MESAEGKIQEKGYTATFPILVNIADTPSYFISLKDSAGLVKAYSFVSVANYQIVGVADTVADAESEYRRLLKESGKLNENTPSSKTETVTGIVSAITSAVVNGNTCYYIRLGSSDAIYIANVSLNDALPFVKVGDPVTITIDTNGDKAVVTAVNLSNQ